MSSAENPYRVVFLYTELAGYIKRCIDALAHSGAEVHVVAWPVNPEAPFQFGESLTRATYLSRADFDLDALIKLVKTIAPHMVVCSGWLDIAYLEVCKSLPRGAKKVLALDNQYSISAKSLAGMYRAKLLYRKIFTHAWVPGAPQVKYAIGMGFPESAVYTGFYCADTRRFRPFFENSHPDSSFPRRFVYTGRYAAEKGVKELWKAFETTMLPGWVLDCAGTGPLWAERPLHRDILHRGFVQPEEMGIFVQSGGVFVLPSIKEPWGVVLHEFAASGYPIICSRVVGAASAFAVEGSNARLIEPGHIQSLAEAMLWYTSQSDEKLWEMARHSAALGHHHTPEVWVQTAYRILAE